ncbi:hypothetical protein GGR51DRAFT_503002 [Nemania sp. FL0031]|nr:hypothetical protein GGR51DRAFT_503002 [Nemania sp. FL0031]
MMPANRLRRHSLSSGDESFHPHPAKLNDLPRQGSRRRARLPRSKSTSNVFDAYSRIPGTTDHDMRNVAFEQADIATLRELASFLRTTGPPPERPAIHDDCLPFSGAGEPRRWSLQSFRRNKRMKLQRYSLSHLPENVTPGTTAEGHRYIAISTPTPNNSTTGGPWFRSQYPVFLPQSPSPRSWPERSSSKAASLSSTEKGVAFGNNKKSPRSTDRLDHTDQSPRAPTREGARSRAFSNRISSDHLLRAMLNPVDETSENNSMFPSGLLGSREVAGVEQEQLTLHVAAASNQNASPSRSSQHNAWRQSPPLALESRGSSRSPNQSFRRPGNILVQASLAVPKQDLPPESPGFPKMLANMTFPSPPKGSRPSSPASTISSVPDSQGSPGSRPVMLPRTSSRRAYTSTPGSAASLDELVMQTRPGSKRGKSDRLGYGPKSASSGASIVEAPSGSRPSTATLERPSSLLSVVPGEIDHGSIDHANAPDPSHEQPVVPPDADSNECHGESRASQLTSTTDSSRQSTLTHSSSRSSSATEMSARSESTITAQKTSSDTTRTSRPVDLWEFERCANVEDVESKPIITDPDDVGLAEMGNRDCGEQHVEPQRPSLRLSTTSNTTTEPSTQPKSILERRLARKAKVREYKMRDLDASRTDVVDSPVLGYFASNISQGHNPVFQAPSASINNSRRPSTLSMATTTSDTLNEPPSNPDVKGSLSLHAELPVPEERSQTATAVDASRAPNVELKMSMVITTVIEPIYPPAPHWHSSGITMSPIMVVADVESQPGSPTLRVSSLARLESPSPRAMTRLKPLKISAHSRQKSHTVTISRNPSTGVIERSASGPIDPKFNRRSLMTMPTPPMSPEATMLSKRLSLPPTQSNFPVTPRDQTLLSRQSSPDEEREPESRLRSTALRERVMREKLQKEKEITDIVARTVGLPPKQAYDAAPDSPILSQNNAESLEKRLKRLERTNDAWLCAMKPLLETMARTLDDMRVDDRCRSLRMSDFVIDMEAEARRVTHSRLGEKESVFATLQSSDAAGLGRTIKKNNFDLFSSTPLSPVLQEFDDSPVVSNQPALITLKTSDILPRKNQELLEASEGTAGSSNTSQRSESRLSEVSQRMIVPSDTGPTGKLEKRRTVARSDGTKTSTQVTGAIAAGCVGEGEGPGDWTDLDLLIMPRKSREERESGESPGRSTADGPNTLNPLMRELMSASQLTTEKVMTAR